MPLDKRMAELPHLGQYFPDGFLLVAVFSTSRMSRSSPIESAPSAGRLLKLYVLIRVSKLHQKLANPFTMISLEHYLTVLCCSTASTEPLQFLGNPRQVRVLLVYAVHYSRWFAKFACFKPYANPLLLFFYLATSTYVLGKSACWTDLSHDTQMYNPPWTI